MVRVRIRVRVQVRARVRFFEAGGLQTGQTPLLNEQVTLTIPHGKILIY